MSTFTLRPIATVTSDRKEIKDDDWGEVLSTITLADEFPEEAFHGLETFSHAEVIFLFDQVDPERLVNGARHPRNNEEWPKVGIFSQRGKRRPNRLGLTTVEVVSREGRRLKVRGLDAIDGTPILDIKPTMREFLPRTEVTQPAWATVLMKQYF